MTKRLVLAVGCVVAVVVAVVLVLHLYPRSGSDRVRHAFDWDPTCLRVRVDNGARAAFARTWKGTESTAVIACDNAGGFLYYARFGTEAQLHSAIATLPRRLRYCTYDLELVTDDVFADRSTFVKMCDSLDGRLGRPATGV
jgi:hypothetical protein